LLRRIRDAGSRITKTGMRAFSKSLWIFLRTSEDLPIPP